MRAAAISRAPSARGFRARVYALTPSVATAEAVAISRREIAAAGGTSNPLSRTKQTGATRNSEVFWTGTTPAACTSTAFRGGAATSAFRATPRPGHPVAVLTRRASTTGAVFLRRPDPGVGRASVAARRPSSRAGSTSKVVAPAISTAMVLTGKDRQVSTSRAAVSTVVPPASTPSRPSSLLPICTIGSIITHALTEFWITLTDTATSQPRVLRRTAAP